MDSVLITGGSGLLGKYLRQTSPNCYDISYTYKTHPIHNPEGYYMDLNDRHSIAKVFEEVKPNIIIHTAAIGSVDYCESHQQEALDVIVEGTRNVLDECKKHDSKIVYISSNAVYDGENSPYSETDITDPINWYGKCKLVAENLVQESRLSFLIVRPILLYGWPHKFGRLNWVNIIVASLSKGLPVSMVYDTLTQPTYAVDCARVIWMLMLRDREGIYNVGSDSRVTLFAFALEVAQVWGYDMKLVKGMSSDRLQLFAPRPRDTTYDLVKLRNEVMECERIEYGLQRMRGERNDT